MARIGEADTGQDDCERPHLGPGVRRKGAAIRVVRVLRQLGGGGHSFDVCAGVYPLGGECFRDFAGGGAVGWTAVVGFKDDDMMDVAHEIMCYECLLMTSSHGLPATILLLEQVAGLDRI